jgi:hypothetical protein
MTRLRHASLAALVLSLGSGCTGSDSIPRIAGAPNFPSEVSSLRYDSDYALSGLATAGDGMIVAGDAAALWLNDGSLTTLSVRADAGEADSTGQVHALSARRDNVLLSSDSGLFETWDDELLRSPLNDNLADQPLRALHSSGQGDSEQIWAASDLRVYRIAGGALTEWTLDDLDGAIRFLAYDGELALIATSQGLYELDPVSSEVEHIDGDFGTLYGLSVGTDGRAYIASDAGLVARSIDGAYSVYTLRDDAGSEPVTAVYADPSLGVVAATNTGLITLSDDGAGPVGLAAFDASQQVAALSCDDDAYCWLTHDKSLQGWLVGEATSFAQDIQPILENNCTRCHDDGGSAPTFDLRDYAVAQARATDIMTRLDAQQMPPDEPLANSDYTIFRRWYRSGQNP